MYTVKFVHIRCNLDMEHIKRTVREVCIAECKTYLAENKIFQVRGDQNANYRSFENMKMYPKLISFLKRISRWDADHFKVKKFEFSPLRIALCKS